VFGVRLEMRAMVNIADGGGSEYGKGKTEYI
jgi:hypothetical protein